MRRAYLLVIAALAAAAVLQLGKPVLPPISTPVEAQAAPAVDNRNAPTLAFESVPDPLKLPPGMNFGEILSVAVNSRGTVVVRRPPHRIAEIGTPFGSVANFESAGSLAIGAVKRLFG